MRSPNTAEMNGFKSNSTSVCAFFGGMVASYSQARLRQGLDITPLHRWLVTWKARLMAQHMRDFRREIYRVRDCIDDDSEQTAFDM